MDYENLYNALGKQEESQTEKIMADREKIKDTMSANLQKIGFTKMEINEVIDIITLAEADIQVIKDSLIGTNINTYDPTPVMKKAFDEMRELQVKMGEDIKNKIQEIKIRKAEYQKELDYE